MHQEEHRMKKMTLGIVLSVAVAAQISAAAAPVRGSAVQVDAQQIELAPRAPIRFMAFPMIDPHTGQKLSPNAIITLKDGTQVTVAELFKRINQYEEQINAMGYTLRQPVLPKLAKLKVDQEELQAQMAMLPAARASIALARRGTDGEPVVVVKPVGGGGGTPPPPPPPPTTPPATPGGINKAWSYVFGNRDTVGAEISGDLNLNGNAQGVNANGVARASGAVLGNEWDLARVTGSLNAPKSGTGAAKLNLYVVGLGDIPLVNQSFTASYSASDSVSRSLDVSAPFSIPVGPFAVSGTLGARGSAGVQYGLNASATGIGVSLNPQVRVDAYAEGGISVGVASGGIGCELTLVNNTLQLGAEGQFITNTLGPALKAHVYATDSLQALSGRIYAYAKVDLWFWDDEWDVDIWNFSGINRNFTLFDESKTMLFSTINPAVLGTLTTATAR
jgi:hypothetical protein